MADWQRLKQLVADALEQPAPERRAFLRDATAGDTDLLIEATQLVDAAADDTAILNPAADRFLGLAGEEPRLMAGRRIGSYELLDVIGEGALAAVYRAKQIDPERIVAVKVFRGHALAVDARRQFRQEVRALGLLRHPHIAQIHEAGVHSGEAGPVPFIAMELVEGEPITDFADRHTLDTKRRVRLLADVADAVHAAHQKFVIHRDLKPGNVLAEGTAADARPKVLDFGIARITDPGLAQTTRTATGLLLGTLAYMSPEQLAGRDDEIDVRTDVWALGVLLHELLVGRTPADVRDCTLPMALRRLEAARPAVEHPALRGDLGVIIGRALEPERERRFASAAALADDLRRWLRDEPIEARPPTRTYLLKKFARRNSGLLTVAGIFVLSLAGAATAATWGYVQAERARQEAVEARNLALASEARTERVNGVLQAMIAPATTAGIPRLDEAELLRLRGIAESIDRELSDDPDVAANARANLTWMFTQLGAHDEALTQIRKSYDEAADSLGEDSEPALSAAAMMVDALLEVGDVEAAGGWVERLTAATADRLETDELRLLVDQQRAATQLMAGDSASAVIGFSRLIEIIEQLPESAQRVRLNDLVGVVPNHVWLRNLRNELGRAHLQAGDFAEAAALFAALRRQVEAEKPIDAISLLHVGVNLAQAHEGLGETAASRAAVERALAAAAGRVDADTPILQEARTQLADSLAAGGEFEEAVKLYDEAVASVVRRAGEQSPDTIRLRHNRSALLLKQAGAGPDSPAPAELVDQIAANAAAAAKVFGEDSVLGIETRTLHATVIGHRDPTAALPLLGQLAQSQARLYGPEHPSTLITRNNRAFALLNLSRFAEAATEYAELVSISETRGYVPLLPPLKRNLGRSLAGTGDVEAAMRQLEQSAALYEQLGQVAEAEKSRQYLREAKGSEQPER